RRQAALHLTLLAAALVFLPVHLSDGWDASLDHPVVAVLGLLMASVGMPFVVVAGSAPLLQRWFTLTGHWQAANPYPLYAASNAGRMVGLRAYPLVLEPVLDVSAQGIAWTIVYVCLIVLMVACAAVFWRAKNQPSPSSDQPGAAAGAAPERWDRLRWVALAFIP